MSYLRVLSKRVPLDNSYENVITFKDIYNAEGELVQEHMTKEAFFKNYDSYFNNLEYYQKVNFRYGNTLTTSCKLIDKTISENELAGLNYCHVVNDSNPRYPRDMFYFIVGINYLSGNVIELNLELDVYTTYFDYTSLHGSSPIFTKRCHCDRYNNYNGLFGCEEALFPDSLDNNFEGNILVSRNKIFGENSYIIVYVANNAPRTKANNLSPSTTGSMTKVLDPTNASVDRTTGYTTIKNITAPYFICVLPVNTISLTYSGWDNNTYMKYGLNANAFSGTIYHFLMSSQYILGMQFSSFDFSNYLKINSDTIFVEANDIPTATTYGYYMNAPLILIDNLEEIKETKYLSNITLYESAGYGDNFVKTYMQNITKRDKALEPKLYTQPYTKYTITSACEKELAFEPMLTGQKTPSSSFIKTFSPSPISSGEMTFLGSYPYEYYKSNYLGSAPVINTEIPLINDNYQTFITTQKNSFWTGVGLNVANNAIGTTGNILSNMEREKINIGANIKSGASSITNIMMTGINAYSKLKDLKNTPNKLSGNNFDIYSIILNTDINKYVNTWSLMPSELEKVSDFYYLNGYSVDMFRDNNMSSKSVICSKKSIITRRLFDYLQVDENLIDTMNYNKSGEYPMSQVIREKINDTLNRGVRLWFITNVDDYKNFTLENKEIN